MAPPFGKSDISNQLIRDSYQYVLQADTVTGVMYRINGDFLVNPIFTSGLTIYSGFTYVDGNEQSGYVLTSDGSGNAFWAPASAATPSSGVTSITVGEGLSANSSTGAVTIVYTGGTSGPFVKIAGGEMTGRLYNEEGITVTGDVTSSSIVTTNLSADTISATTLTIVNSSNITSGSITADTYSGNTIIVNNFTAVTVSATTYLNLPESADTKVTGFSLNNNVITLSQNRTDEYSAFTISLSAYTGSSSTSGAYLPLSGGTVTGGTIFQSGLTTNTISATTYYNVNAVTGGTYSNGVITLSGTGSVNGNQITGLSALTPNTLYSGDGLLSGNRIVNLSSYTLNFSSTTYPNTLFLSGGNIGIGTISSTNKLHISGDTDPVRIEGVQTSTDNELLTIDGSGVVHKVLTSSVVPFLRNETNSGATDTITINQSIFNPSNLTVLSTSVFIVDTNADYYILGDLYNYGSVIVNGTLKVGGIIYNYGTITGPGIIE
jgi:hypothetical protein